MLQLKSHSVSTDQKGCCATAKDFEQLFAQQNTDLLRLSLHLTADAEKAECCVILAMRDCFFGNSALKVRVHTWARRMVMRNAIRMVWETPSDILGESGFEFYLQPSDFSLQALRESVAILSLPDLDRLAFVICILERYSILDCAVLLTKAPQEVHDAIVRATSRVLSLEGRKDHEVSGAIAGKMHSAFWDQRDDLDGSCGAILD